MTKRFELILLLVVVSCAFDQKSETASKPIRNPSADIAVLRREKPFCYEMVKEFCEFLYSPEHQGSLEFSLDNTHFSIRQGQTENDFNEKDFEFLSSKLKSWSKLPYDFRLGLDKKDFRAKLKRHLNRTSRQSTSLQERIRNLHDEEEIDSIWNSALKETVLVRMEHRYRGYSRIKDEYVPLELKYESQRERRHLLSDIASALWKNHENWRKVERKFNLIRDAYLELITGEKNIPEKVKNNWIDRLKTVRLIVPGSDPEIDSDLCASTEENAYYFREKNALTVCAGDFNTEDIEQTIAHEIGHALDVGRSRFLYKEESRVGMQLKNLKKMSCSNEKFSCGLWSELKGQFNMSLKELAKFEVQLPALNNCLKGKETVSPIPQDVISRIAKEEIDQSLSDLAQRNVFLRIISSKVPLPNGSSQKNPMYLNPCGYYLWEDQAQPLDSDMGLLMFFTAEYRCSEGKDPELKFRDAVEVAKEMQMSFLKSEIKMEGDLSSREQLYTDGYAASPAEQFADAIGQKVFSKILASENSLQKRRARYLANNAWLCRRPSIQQLFPIEAKVQRSYYVEPHSELVQRQKELLTSEIRDLLDCKIDFEEKQCSLSAN